MNNPSLTPAKTKLASAISVVLSASLLSACGGGSSSSPTPTPSSKYKLSGAVTGLTTAGLSLKDGTGKTVTVSANATSFSFNSGSAYLTKNAAYAVGIAIQPKSQTCSVANGSGKATANVSNVKVTCKNKVLAKYSLSGSVSGATEAGLKLADGSGKTISVAKNATNFSFGNKYLESGKAYNVTVVANPKYTNCKVTNGKGTITKDISNIKVACSPLPVKPVASIVGNKKFSWQIQQPVQVKLVDANRDNAPLKVTGCSSVDANKAAITTDCSKVTLKRIGMQPITVKGENNLSAQTKVQGVPVRMPFQVTSSNETNVRLVTPEGKVLVWGNVDSSEQAYIGVKDPNTRKVIKYPEYVLTSNTGSAFANAYQVTTGDRRIYVLNETGTIYAMGGYGAPYKSIDVNTKFPAPIQDATRQTDTKNYVAVAQDASFGTGIALKDDGKVYQFNVDKIKYPETVKLADGSELKNIKAIAGGSLTAYAITNAGKVYTWRPGKGSAENTPKLIKLKNGKDLTGITKVVDSTIHTLALGKDSKVWAWGENRYNQLGDSTLAKTSKAITYANPVKLPTNTATDIAVGFGTSFALMKNGEVLAWGSPLGYKLGLGANVEQGTVPTPTNVVSESGSGKLTNVKAISAFLHGGYALKADGTLVGWGGNYDQYTLTRPKSEVVQSPYPRVIKGVGGKSDLKLAPVTAYPSL